MKLESAAFRHEEEIPAKYTCDGREISPPLKISSVPQNAKSLVLIMEDPDVPKAIRPDGLWIHWVVFNIVPTDQEIAEATSFEGVAGKNTKGSLGYIGPSPPSGSHRYFFKLYALDKMLDLSQGASKIQIEEAMKDHVIEETALMGKYARS